MTQKTVSVTATAKGYHNGPREPGDVFELPVHKDGKDPKGSWFTVNKREAAPLHLHDEDLA